jgi:nicotinate-nucleotide adenylyltransferase
LPDRRNNQNIGILGGTFDPVHEGHLCIARQLRDTYKLDLILFIPAALPPHKQQPAASYSHRVAMLEAALFGESRMSVSLIEAERSNLSYTIDTLRELQQRLGPHNFHLIIGADAFSEFHLWYQYPDILKKADLIVAARPGFTLQDFLYTLENLPGQYRKKTSVEKWSSVYGRSIAYYPKSHETVSSTSIRNFLRQKKTVAAFLPKPVVQYIQKHKLYYCC